MKKVIIQQEVDDWGEKHLVLVQEADSVVYIWDFELQEHAESLKENLEKVI